MSKVYVEHMRALQYCCWGIKKWFETKGLDYKKFLREGIDEEVLLSFDDAMARKAVELMRKQNGK